jgi:hypothetical protein
MSTSMRVIRKRALKRARKLEDLIHDLWSEEARLTEEAASSGDTEARELAADLGCLCVDLLHPAVEALRRIAEPRPRREPESEDDPAPTPPETPAQ